MRRTDELERRLRVTGTDADKVRAWLERRARPFLAREGRSALDGELRMLAQAIVDSFPLSAWEMAGAAKRRKYASQVKKHAKALARLLSSEDAPYCPPALGLFDEASANAICDRFDPELARHVRGGTRFDLGGPSLYWSHDGEPFFIDISNSLSSLFWKNSQGVAGLLDSLVVHIDSEAAETNESYRGKQRQRGDPERRVLALHLARYFRGFFGQLPNEIIACCINIAHPEADPLASEELVRSWRGSR